MAPAAAEVAGDEASAENARSAEGEDVAEKRTHRTAPPPPVGVRFAEPLEDQRFRLAYRFERTQKQGLRVGTRDRSPSQVLPPNSFNPYDRTPRSLEVSVHEFQLAYAPHPRATLVVEVPFFQKTLETRLAASGQRIQDETSGVGDVGFALVVPFIRKGDEASHVHVGFDVPTGSIRRGGDETRLPFDLQIGNGTFDLEWGWTYRGEWEWLSWGGQAWGRHPIGRNGLGYREGSRFEASFWGGARLLERLSTSLRFAWEKQNNTRQHLSPADPITDPADNPMARGGIRLSVNPGVTIEMPGKWNQRLAVEVAVPVYQDLDGPQLEKDWSVRAGWECAF